MTEKLSTLLRKFLLLFTNPKICNAKERNNIINGLNHWLNKRSAGIRSITNIKIGDVYYFEYGLNILPMMSYQHMGIVMAKNTDYLYVLPITSYIGSIHSSRMYHPSLNKIKNSDFFLMKSNEFSFLTKDSIAKTRDLRCVVGQSINDSIGLVGHIDITSDFFVNLKEVCFKTLFNDISFEMEKLHYKYLNLQMQVLLTESLYSTDDEFINKFSKDFNLGKCDLLQLDDGTVERTISLIDTYAKNKFELITYIQSGGENLVEA